MSSLFARAGRSADALQKNTIVNKPRPKDDNHARFSKLVLPHLADAYALAYRITGSRADDASQEACLRAFRAVGDVTDNSARLWMVTIMRNAAYAWIRKNRPTVVFGVDDLEGVESARQSQAPNPTWRPLLLLFLIRSGRW
jgi:DNA-directed RNA polymerase specialized sigma24 family protein